MNTRLVLLGDWKPKGHKIYREIEKVLKDSNIFNGDRLLDNCSFMNAFQRPAFETGQSIKKHISDLDVNSSLEVIKNVISIIEPDIVIFLSKLSWNHFGASLKTDYPNRIIDYAVHPASYGYWYSKIYKDSRFKVINIIKNN